MTYVFRQAEFKVSERQREKQASRERDEYRMERGEVSPDDIRDKNGLFSGFDRSKARLVSRRVHVRITMARGICDAPKDSTAHSRSEFFGSLIGAEVIYVCAGERNPEFRFMFPEKPRPENSRRRHKAERHGRQSRRARECLRASA